MTYIPMPNGSSSANNSKKFTNLKGYRAKSGSVVSSTKNTTTIDTIDSTNQYQNKVFEIVEGKGRGQVRKIETSNTSGEITFDKEWIVVPDTTSKYIVHQNSGRCVPQTQQNSHISLLLNPTDVSGSGYYDNTFLKIWYKFGSTLVCHTDLYDHILKILTVDVPFKERPGSDCYYAIFGESGTSISATQNSLTLDTLQSDVVSAGHSIYITSGTGSGQTKMITDLTGDIITVDTDWMTEPDSTSKYVIYGGWAGEFDDVVSCSSAAIQFICQESSKFVMDIRSQSSDGSHRDAFFETGNSEHIISMIAELFQIIIIAEGTDLNGYVNTTLNPYRNNTILKNVKDDILDITDTQITKSVIVGKSSGGAYKTLLSDSFGKLEVNVPRTAFGELSINQNVPIFQTDFTYGIPLNYEIEMNPGTFMTVLQESPLIYSLRFSKGSTYINNYFVHYNGNGAKYVVYYGTAPSIGGATLIPISVDSNMSPADVAETTFNELTIVDTGLELVDDKITFTNVTNTVPAKAISPTMMPKTSNGSIGTVKGTAIVDMTTGTGSEDYVHLRSSRVMSYRTGQGLEVRFTAIYDDPVQNVTQLIGPSTDVSGILLGYVNEVFGIYRRTGGMKELYTLTITKAATTSGTVDLLINGVLFTVSLVKSTVHEIASTIANIDYSSVGYVAESVDNTVRYVSKMSMNAKSFSLTSSIITGTFTKITDNVPYTVFAYPQYEWNVDRLDGYGPSGMIFNPQKGNVFKLEYKWLGFGQITLYLEETQTGAFIPCHQIRYNNQNTDVTLNVPHMKMSYIIESNGVSATLKTASNAGFIQGILKYFDPAVSISNTHNSIGFEQTNRILFALRNPLTFNGIVNYTSAMVQSITCALSLESMNSSYAIANISFVVGGTPSIPMNYTYVNDTSSAMFIARPNLSLATLTGGNVFHTLSVSQNTSFTEDISNYNYIIPRNTTVYIIYNLQQKGICHLSASINWIENQ